MRPTRSAFLLFVTFLISIPVAAQQPPQPDPQAVAILTQCLNAAGGAQAFAAVRDFSASGTITYYWAGKEVQGNVKVRGRGTGQFRLDATLPEGVRSWVVSDGAGSLKEASGNIGRIPYHNAVDFGSLTFPLSHILAALNDPSMSISYLGVVTKSGREFHQIRVRQTFSEGADPGGILTKLNTKDFFIDAASFQVSRTLDMIHPEKDSTQDHPHEMEFSDYRPVNGLFVPFSITEKIGGQRTWTIQLSAISFNPGLTDADFKL